MTKNFSLLEKSMSPESVARSHAKADAIVRELELSALQRTDGAARCAEGTAMSAATMPDGDADWGKTAGKDAWG